MYEVGTIKSYSTEVTVFSVEYDQMARHLTHGALYNLRQNFNTPRFINLRQNFMDPRRPRYPQNRCP